LQVVINLSEPGVDHTGGEFLLVEQRPRAQSRGTATLLPQGHGYLFTTRDRPVRSARGWSAAPIRHADTRRPATMTPFAPGFDGRQSREVTPGAVHIPNWLTLQQQPGERT